MTNRKGFLSQQNTFLDTIATKFDGTHSNFVLGNAQAIGCPIVYCSDGFCELTGYARAQVMGKSCACKFLYGGNTEEKDKQKIDDALENKEELKTELSLKCRNGNTFMCLLDIVPIKNEKSQVVLFLVSHKDISKNKTAAAASPPASDNESSDDSDGDLDENFRPPNGRCRSSDMPSDYNYGRRRSRAVLYHLSGQFDKQNKAKSKLQQLNKLTGSISTKMPEYKVQEVKKSRFVIAHYGIFKIGWDWLILLCTFYTAIMVPYNASFITVDGNYRSSIYSDVVVESLFIIDIILNFRTSFVSKSGQVVYDARLVALNYMRGWFLLDLLAAIPFDFLYVLKVDTSTPVHLLKLGRLLRLARLLQKIDRYSQYSAIVVTLLMSMFALSAHWLACIWYAIGNGELESNPSNWTVGWLPQLSLRIEEPIDGNKTNKPNVMTSYLTALYFTCSSLTSVGFGNVSANTNFEKIFSVCAMLIGAMMHAVVFGNVTAIIQRMYARRANYHSRTKDLKDFFRTHHIPKPLKHRMQEYFQTIWSMNNGIDTFEILKDFPEEMRGEIGLQLHKDILSLPIFEDATQGCLKSISLQTRRAFCAPGEFLVHKGDAVNYVYLLCSGSMEVLKEEMVVAILGKGDLFGTDVNFDDPVGISCCDVRSLTYCELQGINIKGLADVLSLYPDFSEKFAQDIRHDLSYNLKEGYEESENLTPLPRKSDNDLVLPVGRVMTLPSISEDDEDEESDDSDNVFGKDEKGDTCESPGSNKESGRHSSPTSPLLTENKAIFSLPNGDIDALQRESFLSRRTKTPLRLNSTTKFKMPNRKRQVSNQSSLGSNLNPDSSQGLENLSASLLSLHTEVEGTKTNMKQLEKKVDSMGSELSNIEESLKTVIKLLTPNQSEHSGSFPPTPFSPCSRPQFTFGSPTSDDIPNEYESTQTLEVPGQFHSKTVTPQDKARLCTSAKLGACNNARKDLSIKINKSSEEFESLLRKSQASRTHEPLDRCHSDTVAYSKPLNESVVTADGDSMVVIDMGDNSIKSADNIFGLNSVVHTPSKHVIVHRNKQNRDGYVLETTDL